MTDEDTPPADEDTTLPADEDGENIGASVDVDVLGNTLVQHEDPAPTSDTKGTPAPEATTPTGQDPASAAPAVPDTIGLSLTPETSAPAPAGDLPRTGFPVCTLTVLALGLLLVGNALRLLSRRAATR